MAQTAPVAQARTLRFLAKNMVVAGLIVGIGMPVGGDAAWLLPCAAMSFDFVLARTFWRRAIALEQGTPAR